MPASGKIYPISEDIIKRMEGVNDPEDWSPCSDYLFYKRLDDINFQKSSIKIKSSLARYEF